MLGWNDSSGVLLSWDGTTPGESFCSGMERLQRSHSVLEWNAQETVAANTDLRKPVLSEGYGENTDLW